MSSMIQLVGFGLVLVVSVVIDGFQFHHHVNRHHQLIKKNNKAISNLSSHSWRLQHQLRLKSTTTSTESTSSTTTSSDSSSESPSSSNKKKSNNEDNKFDNFDYYNHWYPVIWKDDLVYNEPTKITLFDIDYVVAKTLNKISGEDEVIALQDICPHKLAKLSQGRVTTTGNIQCSYHGWSFNGTTGQCIEIPQVVNVVKHIENDSENDNGDNDDMASMISTMPSFVTNSQKSKATAIPIMIQYGMVWMFPGGNLEKALLAPPPPIIPELEQDDSDLLIGSISMRDMPIDFPILISNICDPDHGPFAHQSKNFDMYTASKQYPQQVTEEFPNNCSSYILQGRVDAAPKLFAVNDILRDDQENKDKKKKKKKKKNDKDDKQFQAPSPLLDDIRSLFTKNDKKMNDKNPNNDSTTASSNDTPWATTYYEAPSHIRQKRVDKVTGKTNFITTFFVCPVGVGRSRFMAASISKMKVPRWITTLMLDNFLDQDTYLLATQQQNQLPLEVNEIRNMIQEDKTQKMNQESISGDDDDENVIISNIVSSKRSMTTRRNHLFMPSPTEKFGSRLEQFWDATLTRMPNRVENLLKLDNSGAFLPSNMPSREIVLDRASQNLQHSSASQGVVKNCQRIMRISKFISGFLLVAKLYVSSSVATVSASSSWMMQLNRLMKPSFVVGTILVSTIVGKLADKLRREFYFKYTDKLRQRDLATIPKKVWIDK